jgi:hypothetical protein
VSKTRRSWVPSPKYRRLTRESGPCWLRGIAHDNLHNCSMHNFIGEWRLQCNEKQTKGKCRRRLVSKLPLNRDVGWTMVSKTDSLNLADISSKYQKVCHVSPFSYPSLEHKNTRHNSYAYCPLLLQTKQLCWLKCAFLAVWSGGHNLWTVGHKSPWILQFLW